MLFCLCSPERSHLTFPNTIASLLGKFDRRIIFTTFIVHSPSSCQITVFQVAFGGPYTLLWVHLVPRMGWYIRTPVLDNTMDAISVWLTCAKFLPGNGSCTAISHPACIRSISDVPTKHWSRLSKHYHASGRPQCPLSLTGAHVYPTSLDCPLQAIDSVLALFCSMNEARIKYYDAYDK